MELCSQSLKELTLAEREVTLLVLDGLTNAEIGAQRHSSPRTVANQIAAVFRKLSIHGRLELIRRLTLGVTASPPAQVAPEAPLAEATPVPQLELVSPWQSEGAGAAAPGLN